MRHNKRRNKRAREQATREMERKAKAVERRAEFSGLAFFGKLDPDKLRTAQAMSRSVQHAKRKPFSTLS